MARRRRDGPGSLCGVHSARPAVALCAICGARLCDECYRFRTSERPACARCAYEATTHARRRIALAVGFFSLSAGGAALGVLRWNLWGEHPVLLVLFGIAVAIVTGALAASSRSGDTPPIENRPEDLADDPHAWEGAAHPYRGRARRVITEAAPKLSGTATALVVALSLGLTAGLLPVALKLPRWIEVEAVLGGWWALFGLALAGLLHRGFRLADDWIYFAPWDRPKAEDGKKPSTSGGTSTLGRVTDGCSGLEGCSGADGEGCIGALVVGLAVVVALGAAWVLVEIAIPVVFLLVYALIMRAIARVARDRHDCKGRLGRSLAWGALWSAIYVAPLALATWGVHAALPH